MAERNTDPQAAPAGKPGWALEALDLKRAQFHGKVVSSGSVPPPKGIELVVAGEVVEHALLSPLAEGGTAFSAPVPADALEDGVHTVVFRQAPDGVILGSYVLRAGQALSGDVTADLSALKAELNALKRAFMAEAADRKLRAAERPLIVEETVTSVLRELSGVVSPARGRPEDG